MSEPPVIVAGGGIAGLSAALAIARTGRHVLVFEREAERSNEGAGVQLSPNATRRLREWNVLDPLSAHALTPDGVVLRRASDAGILARMDLRDAEQRWGAPFRIVHRADLQAALFTTAEREPGITVRRGIAVSGWTDADALCVRTSDGQMTGASALIIADGVHSTLRASLLERRDDRLLHSGRVAWRALVPADRAAAFARQPVSNLWLGPDAHVVHYPLRGGSVVNVVAIVKDRSRDDGADLWSRAGDSAVLAQRFAAWDASLRTLIAAADAWRVWPLLSRRAPDSLARGRVAAIGDAAHPMMPFLAQGAAQAIEDAAALGDALAAQFDAAEALAAFSRSRIARVRRVLAASERQATIYHLRGPAAFARDTVMRVLGSRGMHAATDWIYRG